MIIMLQLNHLLNNLLKNKYVLKIEDIVRYLDINMMAGNVVYMLLEDMYVRLFQNPFNDNR